jgi:hypothetical protein
MALTNGLFDWIAVTGRHHSRYFLLRSERFDITLEPASKSGKGTTEPGARPGPIRAHPVTSAWQNGGTAVTESGPVAIESDPPLADIYVDWKFAGQTPSTIRLASGPHHIELKLHGRQNWERELEVTNGSEITLRPILELLPLNPTDH